MFKKTLLLTLLVSNMFGYFDFASTGPTNIRAYAGPIEEFVGKPKYYVYKNIENNSEILYRKMEAIPLANNDTLLIRTTYNINKEKVAEWRNIINKYYIKSVDTDFKYLSPSEQPWLLSVNDKYIERKVGKQNREVPDTVNYDRVFLGIVDNYYKNILYESALFYDSIEIIYDEDKVIDMWIHYRIKDVGLVKWFSLRHHYGYVLDRIIDEDEFLNIKYNNENNYNQSKYVGTHEGGWEGFVLSHDVLSGPATFIVSEDNSATLKMSGDVKAFHSGYVDGDTFVSTTGDGSRNSIVDMGGGNFKIVLIWTGVNVDVHF